MKKLLSMLVLIISMVCLIGLAGCNNQYNAVLYDNANKWIKEDFIKNNLTAGAFYDDIQTGEVYPSFRIFIVKNDEDKTDIFNNSFEVDIDFEKDMLIVYSWTTLYHRECKIKSIDLNGDTLYVNYRMSSAAIGVGDASMPFQRWLVIKLDLLSVTSVEFKNI